jgi:hypothetical protein
LGETSLEVLQQLNQIRVNWRLSSAETKHEYVDQTINLCGLQLDQVSNFAVKIFVERNEKRMDKKLFSCPWKVGNYTAVKARTISKEVYDFPDLVPQFGKFLLKIILSASINKKRVVFYSSIETLEITKVL